jgi:hypothetical protein
MGVSQTGGQWGNPGVVGQGTRSFGAYPPVAARRKRKTPLKQRLEVLALFLLFLLQNPISPNRTPEK